MSKDRWLGTIFLSIVVLLSGVLCTQVYAVELTDSAGFTYYINDDGSAINEGDGNGLGDAYDNVYYLYVDGSQYSSSFVTFEDEDREAVFAAVTIAGLEVSRKFFVPADENFVRILNILHNPTGGDITVDVSVSGNLGSDGSTTLEATSSGDLVLDTDDRWMVTNGDSYDPRLAHLWDGLGAADAIDSIDSDTGSGNDSIGWTWSSVTVPAGETRIYMTFGVMQTTVELAQAQAEAIDDFSLVTQMIEGLSGPELAALANWGFADDDNDGMIDAWEDFYGLNTDIDDSGGDLDEDGLTNGEEFDAGTDPTNIDTDGDGLGDFDEIMTYGTSPTSADTDRDGFSDYAELDAGNDPLDPSDGKIQTVMESTGYLADQPNIALDGAGNYHMVWMEASETETNDYREIYYQLVSADGTILIDRTLVSELNDDDSVRPAVAAGLNGQVLIAWHEYGGVLTLAVLDISLDDQNGSSADIETIKVMADYQYSDGMTPDLAVDMDGAFYVAYTDNSNSGTSVLKLTVGAAPGYTATFEDPIVFSTYDSRGEPRVKVDSQKRVHLLWNDSDIYYALIDGNDGTVLFDSSDTPILETPGGGSSKWQDFALQGDDRMWVVWRDNSSKEVYYTVLDVTVDGDVYSLTEVLAPTLVSLDDEIEARYPDCMINADGNLIVVWYEGGSYGENATLIERKVVAADGSVVQGISDLVTTATTSTYWTLPRLFPYNDSFGMLYRRSSNTLGVYLEFDLTPLPPGLEISLSNGESGVDVDFGEVDYDESSDITITLTNNGFGLSDLGIASVAELDILEDPFFIVSDTCSGAAIAPGESCEIVVRFAPTLLAAVERSQPMTAGLLPLAALMALGAGGCALSRRRRLLVVLLFAVGLSAFFISCSDSDTCYVAQREPVTFTDSFDIEYVDEALPPTTINVTGVAP